MFKLADVTDSRRWFRSREEEEEEEEEEKEEAQSSASSHYLGSYQVARDHTTLMFILSFDLCFFIV